MPLSTATLAALGLFRAGQRSGTTGSPAPFFITDFRLKPLQTFLRTKVLEGGVSQLWWNVRTADPETYKRLGLDPDFVDDLLNITPLSLKSRVSGRHDRTHSSCCIHSCRGTSSRGRWSAPFESSTFEIRTGIEAPLTPT